MVAQMYHDEQPFTLVVTGEAENWLPALDRIIGSRWLAHCRVDNDEDILNVVDSGLIDAAVLDDEAQWSSDVLAILRMIRQVDQALPVVVVTRRHDRQWLENALRLAAFSVVTKPLQLEELLRQIQRMMTRMDRILRGDTQESTSRTIKPRRLRDESTEWHT